MLSVTTAELVTYHRPFALRLARHARRKYQARLGIEYEEIVSSAMVGLFETARAHGHLPEQEFKCMAAWRIRGCIKDWLRKADDLPRGARKAGWTEDFKWFSVDAVKGESGSMEGRDLLPPSYDNHEQREKLEWLRGAVDGLKERDRDIVTRAIRGELFEDIARRHKCTAARISQIVSRAERILHDAYVE
jgi:RNA polymerase sigma factor (sigma-70 family)